MDQWYMVFDEDPHGNRNMPLYFLGSCMLSLYWVNTKFNILDFHGLGWGMTEDKEHARDIFQSYILLVKLVRHIFYSSYFLFY